MTLKQVLRWQVAFVCILLGSLTAQAQSGKPTSSSSCPTTSVTGT